MFPEGRRIRPDREGQARRSPSTFFFCPRPKIPTRTCQQSIYSGSGFNGASRIGLLGGGETGWEGDLEGGDGGAEPGEPGDPGKTAGEVGVAGYSDPADKVVDVDWAPEWR